MGISIAIAGKPNSGKTTLFKALTLANVEIASYPFTTIKANHGISYLRVPCVCRELKVKCEKCIDGNRFIPVAVVDVAGLVPDAHKGRGLGNAFLDEMRQSEAIIHVVDASGSTDIEGNQVGVSNHDPLDDIDFFEKEVTMWIFGIIKKNWDRISRKAQLEEMRIERFIHDQLTGLGISEGNIKNALGRAELDPEKPADWSDGDLIKFADEIRRISKPLILAANKIDIAPEENLSGLKALEKKGYMVIPTCAAAEVALRLAEKSGLIKYLPGDSDFQVLKPEKLTNAQRNALEKLSLLLKKFGSTGVQQCLNTVVFKLLNMIVVYPVEDENKYCDKNGNILPDAFLVKRGSTARDLAYLVHSDLGEGFLYAIDAKTKRRLGEKTALEHNSVVKIVSAR
ncbi:MAG: redox-regulated ATPase YchF [Halobacteria archaeon]